ncbi:MAG TPA: hypothetical protein VH597_00025 [Verrucomicrobiae bacterium]|jgi:hypothetical protein|nr:hypothetical protein [Verrucomicrobiae bacterium]
MLKLKLFAICCLGLAFFWPGPARAGDWFHAGLLYDEFQLTLEPGHRTEAVGPLFYSEEKDTQKTWALPPLFSDTKDPAVQLHEYDFAYPILTYRRYGGEYRWQFIQLFAWAGGKNQEEQHARRFTLFPFYFQQRSEEPGQNYTAVGPFYGHLKNHLFRDEIFFVMFPLYSETRKRDVVTDNYVYPFFSLRHGTALEGWKLWPIVGHEHKDLTTKTNSFNEIEKVGGHDNRFILWPIYLKSEADIGTDDPVHSVAVLPLYSLERSPKRDSTTVIWPFFSHITDREKKYTEWQTPWPLVDFAHGEGKSIKRVWPFFSQAHNQYLESEWYLWPVYKYNRAHAETLDRSRTRILFFLYSDTMQKNTQTGAARRRVDLWPLFTHQRDYNGSTRLQIFAPLEPILPTSKSIERDYSPVWSVWRAEKNVKTGATSQSLLWNLYRHEATPVSKKCSLLFGLFQYQSGVDGKRVRLFYIPVVRTKPTAAKAEAK